MKNVYHHSVILIIFLSIILQIKGFSSPHPNHVLESDKFNINFVGFVADDKDSDNSTSILSKFWDILAGQEEHQLIKPFSIGLDISGVMYILDQGTCTIQVYDPQYHYSYDFHFPEMVSLVDMTMLPDASLIFSDSRLNQVMRLYPENEKSSFFVTDRKLIRPTGLACNPVTGNVWIVETTAHRISVFDHNGSFIRQIGNRGLGAGQFNFPTFICIDKNQRIYVVDAMNHRIQILDTSGNVISVFGRNGDGSGDLACPKGIACDSYGNIYVVDGLFHAVQIFDENGNYLAHFGRQGQEAGQFWMPVGICIDSHNKIYVADTYNSRIQIFELEEVY